MKAQTFYITDGAGTYRAATDEELIHGALFSLETSLALGAAFCAPADVKNFLQLQLATLEHECFAAMFLTNKHQLIEFKTLFRGTVNAAAVYPREVVKEALAANAAALIVAHNHPSGNPEPSMADRALTRKLQEATQLLDIKLLDHVIVTPSETCSFAERGLL